MPRLAPIGRVDNPEALDLDPIIIPICGYRRTESGTEEIVFDAEFRPVEPTGAALDVVRRMDANGNIQLGAVMQFLDEAVMPGNREAFQAFLHAGDVMIETETLAEVYKVLTPYYTNRPTRRLSASAGGQSPIAPTATAVPAGMVSTSTVQT